MQTYSVIDLLRSTTVVKEYKTIKKEIAKGYDFLEGSKQTKLSTLLTELLPSTIFCGTIFLDTTLATKF